MTIRLALATVSTLALALPALADEVNVYSHRQPELVQPLFSLSQLGAVRQRALTPQGETLTWPPQYAPPNHFAGHFEFGLKYERLNLEFCSRLFAHLGPAEITAWVQNEPTGRYARRTAFLYEWLTGQTLPVPDTAANVAYVDAIDSSSYLSAPKPERVRRHRPLARRIVKSRPMKGLKGSSRRLSR